MRGSYFTADLHTYAKYRLTYSDQIRRGNSYGEEGRVCKRSGAPPSQGAGPSGAPRPKGRDPMQRSPILGVQSYLRQHPLT